MKPTSAPMKERIATAWDRFRAKGLLDSVDANSAYMCKVGVKGVEVKGVTR
jgi:hypothetical protein